MINFKKKYKKLFKAYNKRLKNAHKTSLLSLESNLDYFITYLRLMRDYFILTESPVNADGIENYKISTIATAISEYEQYIASANNVEWLKKDGGAEIEASLNKYKIEKQFHWNCFWEIVKQNMLLWEVRNATI